MSETTFEAECKESVGRLRAALLDLFRAVGADPALPQEAARRFKVNKNLTWKAAKILETEDSFEAALLLPGTSGLDILIDALAAPGDAPEPIVEKARHAARSFDRMVEVHTENRANLELMLDAMGGGDKPFHRCRAQAFRGNSGIWGLQCHTQLVARFIAPSRERPGLLDQGLITGWSGVRRLRPIDAWPLIRLNLRNDDGTTSEILSKRMPLLDADGHDAWLLRPFCTGAAPDIRIRETVRGLSFELTDGAVGRMGEFSCYLGYLYPALVPRFADAHNTVGEYRHEITIPAKNFLLDLFVHESMSEMLQTEVQAYGPMAPEAREPDPARRIPMSERLVDMGPNPRASTPLLENYAGMVDLAVGRGGWRMDEFRLLRLRYEFPPMHSTMVVRYPLPAPPDDGRS